MARTVTVQKIVDEVQVHCQDPSHKLATEAQYVSVCNDEFCRLYAYYVAAEPDRFRTEETITALAATPNYDLPDDWLSTIGVDYVSGETRFELERLQEYARNDYRQSGGHSLAFRVIADEVILYPTPVVGQTYTHIYIPTAPVISSTADTIDCRLGHDKFLQMCIARTLLKTEETYDGRWDDEIGKVEGELKLEANLRYFNQVSVMETQESAMRRRYRFPFGNPWP